MLIPEQHCNFRLEHGCFSKPDMMSELHENSMIKLDFVQLKNALKQ